MKKCFLLLFFVLQLVPSVIFSQKENFSTEQRWARVEQFSKDQLPESALKELDAIIASAQKDVKNMEMVKAMIYKMRFILQKEPAKAPDLILDFEAFTAKTSDIAEKALLHSMTAEMYAKYYQNEKWKINARTEIVGIVPSDLKEWTKNIYFDKIKKHLDASLKSSAVLQKTDAEKFSLLIEKGEDSRTLQPTLFDFLIYRKISILEELDGITNVKNPLQVERLFADVPVFTKLELDSTYNASLENDIVQTYQQLLNFRSKDKNVAALIYADLGRLKYLKENAVVMSDSSYFNVLNSLVNNYNDNSFVVEIYAEIVRLLLENPFNSKSNKKEAYELCVNGIKRFPKYKRISILKNILQEIELKNIDIVYKAVACKDSKLSLEVQSRNLKILQLSVYRINATMQEYYQFHINDQDNRRNDYPHRKLIDKQLISVNVNQNFDIDSTTVNLRTNDFGIYEFCLEEKGTKNSNDRVLGAFVVSNLASIQRVSDAGNGIFYVLDRMSGVPQRDVSISVLKKKWNKNGYIAVPIIKLKTDSTGYFQSKVDSEFSNQAFVYEKGDDRFFSSEMTTYFGSQSRQKDNSTQISIFTDRSIYRPGQTVCFKAIVFRSNKTMQSVAPNTEIEFELKDANDKLISKIKLRTNEFGSVSGNFVLPIDVLNGRYSIQYANYSQSFWVEEYKRPTFEVKISKPTSELVFGERIVLSGNVKSFAGYGIGNAKVKYRIMRNSHHFFRRNFAPDVQISNGEIQSLTDGNFNIKFKADKPKAGNEQHFENQIYTYTVFVEVTDSKGETQQCEYDFSVGDQSLFIIYNIEKLIEKNKSLVIPLRTETLNGESVNSLIKYGLFKMKESDEYSENMISDTNLKISEKVLSGNYDTKSKELKLDLSTLLPGRYKIVFSTTDSHNKEVKDEQVFVVYNKDDAKLPVKSYVWLLAPKIECEVNEIAQIYFGTSTNNTFVLYEIMQANMVLKSQWIPFSNEIKEFNIPFIESYGSGVTVIFTFMKDERVFTQSFELKRKIYEKKLLPSLSLFRNKLLPGENTNWIITVPECKNNNMAEVLVGMTDATLDLFHPNNWILSPTYNSDIPYSPEWVVYGIDTASEFSEFESVDFEEYTYQFDKLLWHDFNLSPRSRRFGQPPMLKSTIRFTAPVIKKDEEVFDGVSINDEVAESEMTVLTKANNFDKSSKEKKKIGSITPRTNFNETAFFYPQLRTDSMGNVKFNFTVPESLTRWNVKMLAHTKDLYFGQGEAQVVTQKDLMVQMNLPRFVRQSDKLVLSANVVNLTDKELNTSVQFEMINPETEKPILLKNPSLKNIILAANETKAVEWELTEFSAYELVTCKVVAQSGNFSDGEQKYLPVLPDKVLVTESMPLVLRGNETRTFNFENLTKNASKVENKNLTVEFSPNPSWYAVQALPSLAVPGSENAFDVFAAYYVNSLAGYIANSNPKLKAVFERWKMAESSKEALVSNLEKNQELKNVLLEETPWKIAAKNETEQKRQIALLFDLNNQQNTSNQYLEKLLQLQMPSGGFSWFKGMPESRYATQEILLNLARLNRLTNQTISANQQAMIKSALKYLDLEMERDFTEMKKYNKNYEKELTVSNIQLFYLHLRSEFPAIPVETTAAEAVKFYTAQSEKFWTNFSLYGQAMMAIVAKRNGNNELALKILKSLKENALKTDEFGMYWAKNSAGYFWNERPIKVQASMIEAFAEISKDQADLDELKLWLLKQKQTQSWDSPLSSVDAIYSLMNYGSDWLSASNDVKIKVGNTVINPTQKEAGTGYFKQTIPVSEITADKGKVTVSNNDFATSKIITSTSKASSIGWGAVYWQYNQQVENVVGQGKELKISKMMFVEKLVKAAKTMIPIEQTVLKKGDKVITRLVITTDRNLEYVSLKDLRPSCLEPVEQLSGCYWKENVCYFKTNKDASTQFFFSYLPKGTYVFEYEQWVNNSGSFSNGIATIQCLYAPEFVGHSGGGKIEVK